MQMLGGCFVTAAINTTGNVLKEKVGFVFKYCYNCYSYITENSSMREFCKFFFTNFFF